MTKRGQRKKTLWEILGDKVRGWVDAVDDALAPPPELIPVPVPVKDRRPR